jgi:hypothetical protein
MTSRDWLASHRTLANTRKAAVNLDQVEGHRDLRQRPAPASPACWRPAPVADQIVSFSDAVATHVVNRLYNFF